MAKRKPRLDIKTSPFITREGAMRVQRQPLQALEGDLEVVKKKYYQTSDYTKIIVGHDNIDLTTYRSLSSLAKDILFYIWHILEYNSPTFELKIDTVTSLFKIERSYAYQAIRELIDVKYIARTEIRQVYWINHNKFFKGNHTFSLYAKPKKDDNINLDKK